MQTSSNCPHGLVKEKKKKLVICCVIIFIPHFLSFDWFCHHQDRVYPELQRLLGQQDSRAVVGKDAQWEQILARAASLRDICRERSGLQIICLHLSAWQREAEKWYTCPPGGSRGQKTKTKIKARTLSFINSCLKKIVLWVDKLWVNWLFHYSIHY